MKKFFNKKIKTLLLSSLIAFSIPFKVFATDSIPLESAMESPDEFLESTVEDADTLSLETSTASLQADDYKFIDIYNTSELSFLTNEELESLDLLLQNYNEDTKKEFFLILYDDSTILENIKNSYTDEDNKYLFLNLKERNVFILKNDGVIGVLINETPYRFDTYKYLFSEDKFYEGIKTLIFYETNYSDITKSINDNYIFDATNSLSLSTDTYELAKAYNESNTPKVHFAFIDNTYKHFEDKITPFFNKDEVFFIINIESRNINAFGFFNDYNNPLTLLNEFGKEDLSNLEFDKFLQDFYTNFDENMLSTQIEERENKIAQENYEHIANVGKIVILGIFLIAFLILILHFLLNFAEELAEEKEEKEKQIKIEQEKFKPSIEKKEPIPVDKLLLKETGDELDSYRKDFNDTVLKTLKESNIPIDYTKKEVPTNKDVKIEYSDEYINQLNNAFKEASAFALDPKNFIYFNNLVEKYKELPIDKKEKIERKYVSKIEASRNKLLSSFRIKTYKKIISEIKSDLKNDKIKENDCFLDDFNNLISQIEIFENLEVKDEEVESILNVYIPYLKTAILEYNNIFTEKKYENAEPKIVEKLKNNIIILINNISESISDKTRSKIYMELLDKNSTIEGLNAALKSNH